ncbi:MAG TPA: cysteine--tRNA ligase [Candidatus Limnocylindrales bacterium]|nr:cysteine--tRNA ligase [Candidatus Limnocylindrales bacterium]
MTIRLTNTLGGAVEELAPLEPGHVRIYSCGPTVYGPAHVGNFRSFVFADLLRRHLAWSGFRVTWVVNITDVDDRIIRDLAERGGTLDQLTGPHIERFLEDLGRLRVTTPDVLPRATEHVAEMAALIATLLDRGHAYRTDDGSIFFRISSWPGYGQLARLDPQQMARGERVAADDYAKDDVRDFALWKGARQGEPSWQTQIGSGRPGWHIECSAMSMKYLGQSFDIHTGGIDLIFPHHENEIAQSEAATGKRFVRIWLHCAHLQMGGAKMARREGNIHRPSEIYARGYRPAHLRYALLATHYRAPLEFTDEALDHARAAVERLTTAVRALDAYVEDRPDDTALEGTLAAAHDSFRRGLDDDLNVSAALAAMFDLVRDLNRRVDERGLSTHDARRGAAALRELDSVLGILDEPDDLPVGAADLLERRAAARAARDWSESDRLRDQLAAVGVVVEDTRDGQRWRRGGNSG